MASPDRSSGDRSRQAKLDLYWIPLGAGGRSVRFNGRVYERVIATYERRPALDIYHSALVACIDGSRFTIEMTPVPDARGPERGVVAEGPVGLRVASMVRWFRYEVRRWPEGTIPDLAHAVGTPILLSTDDAVVRRLLDVLPTVPTLTWGRDQSRAGEMWTCNSIISWAIARAGIDAPAIDLPPRGRAPGWQAGIDVALRHTVRTTP